MANWADKLVSMGIPMGLAARMTTDLNKIPYFPDQFSNIQQLHLVMQKEGLQSLDWWSDFQTIFAQIIGMWPGFLAIGVGTVMSYALKDVKIGKFPLAVIGIVPMAYGAWYVIQPLLPKPTP
jgi:hypothetical protein